jgi:transketolase C-terminal domain/subunit
MVSILFVKKKKMDDFITIATFVFPSELVVAKSKLESEGIECRVLDELTVQSL